MWYCLAITGHVAVEDKIEQRYEGVLDGQSIKWRIEVKLTLAS